MAVPTVPLSSLPWASNTNYTGGPDISTATKVEPAAGRKSDGWRKTDLPPAQEWNWLWHWLIAWVTFIYDEVVSPILTTTGGFQPEVVDRQALVVGQNLVKNPSGAANLADWDLSTPANWSVVTDDSSLGGPYFEAGTPSGVAEYARQRIELDIDGPFGGNDEVSISCEAVLEKNAGWTSGNILIRIYCYDVANGDLGPGPTILLSTASVDIVDWSVLSASGVLPATTAYVKAELVHNVDVAATTFFAVQNIKVERSDTPSVFSDDQMTTAADRVSYDNTTSGLTAEDSQAAIDEHVADVTNPHSVTSAQTGADANLSTHETNMHNSYAVASLSNAVSTTLAHTVIGLAASIKTKGSPTIDTANEKITFNQAGAWEIGVSGVLALSTGAAYCTLWVEHYNVSDVLQDSYAIDSLDADGRLHGAVLLTTLASDDYVQVAISNGLISAAGTWNTGSSDPELVYVNRIGDD